jgi:hypothetical protein
VARLVKGPHVNLTRKIQPLDNANVVRLLDAARGHRFEHLYTFQLGSDLRLGEALGLRWRATSMSRMSWSASPNNPGASPS